MRGGDERGEGERLAALHRADDTDQSYSERQMYRAALERLAREVAAIDSVDETEATKKLEKVLLAAAA